MKPTSHSPILLRVIFWILGFAPVGLVADQGIVLTREYADQQEQFWGVSVFKGSKESVASTRFIMTNGAELVIPKHRIALVLRITDLSQLNLVNKADKEAIQLERDTLNLALGRFNQIGNLIKPVVAKLDSALADFENGLVYVRGKKQEASALVEKPPAPKVLPPEDVIPTIKINGSIYFNAKLTVIESSSITLSHSRGVASIENRHLNDETLALFKQKWPKLFEERAAQLAASTQASPWANLQMAQANLGYNVEDPRMESFARLMTRMRDIYGDEGNDQLLARVLDIAHQDVVPNPNSAAFSRLLQATHWVIDQAEAAAKKFGGTLQHQLEVHAKMVPYLRQ
jgi:hypothetical protein